jgi:hypothetical protein
MKRLVCWAVPLLAVAGAAEARPPVDPIGAYVVVDKVVLEPSAGAPARAQIWGTFVLAADRRGQSYGHPQYGYFYYSAAPGQEDVCRREWADFKRAAGTGTVIGFGHTYELKGLGQLRGHGEEPKAPTPYPVGNGLTKVTRGPDYPPIHELLTAPAPLDPTDGCLVPPGRTTFAVRNIPDKAHPGSKYVFAVQGMGADQETSPEVKAGEKVTKWSPRLALKAGEKYTLRVRATDGDWKGPVTMVHFIVKGQK